MNAVSIITKEYDEISTTHIRTLLSNCIVADPSTEKIDKEKTIEKTKKALSDEKIGKEIEKSRSIVRGLMIFIFYSKDKLYFPIVFDKGDLMYETYELNKSFWFNYAYRLEKICTVLIILERENLLSFGGKPTELDIPECLLGILEIVNKFYKYGINEDMRIDYKKRVRAVNKDNILHYYYLGDEFINESKIKKMKK
jgi:hypothetical protein